MKTQHGNLFTKRFDNSQTAREEYERTCEVCELLKDKKPLRLRIARPVKVEGKVVYYENIGDCVNLREMVCRYRVDAKILFYVGQALAELHLALNPKIYNLDEKVRIHGDFSACNVLYVPTKKLVYVVDFSPSPDDDPDSYSWSMVYRDMGYMIFNIVVKYPIYKLYLYARKENKEMLSEFLAGYESIAGRKIQQDKLAEHIVDRIITNKFVFKRKNPISRFVWTRYFDRVIRCYMGETAHKIGEQTTDWDYRDLHSRPEHAAIYESQLRAKNSAESSLWGLERQCLTDIVTRLVGRKNRYLDFACGTGRVISFLADDFNNSEGVDISEAMLALARGKRPKARLIGGDITKNPDIVGENFDLITAFRFFLRAQDALRREVMGILAEKLAPQGILVFNVHSSRPSFLWLQNCVMNLFRSQKIPSLSRREVAELAAGANLEIVEAKVMGIAPKAVHIPLRPRAWLWLDRSLAKVKCLRRFGSHVIYVCRRKDPQ